MIAYHRITLEDKDTYEKYLLTAPERGCEYSFANLFSWGRQEIAFLHGCASLFSHFYGRTVYPFPIGDGDKRAVLEEIIADSRERGIPCRITGMTQADKEDLERWFPGKFSVRAARDGFDYVYAIDALADLRGKKLQKKRNHFNRFQASRPDYRVEPIGCENIDRVREMVGQWYEARQKTDPDGDYLLESLAMEKVFSHYAALGMEGLILLDGEEILAMTIGSKNSEITFDIHFEKARETADGAYPAINCEFARFLRLKYPEVRYLNREEDMGLEGLRKAKLSYYPDHMVEKYKALLKEDIYED